MKSDLVDSSLRFKRRFISFERVIMLSRTWSIVYWYSPVHAETIRRTSFLTRAMKRAALIWPAYSGAAENSRRRSRS